MEDVSKRITKEQKFLLIQYMEEHAEFAHDRFVNSTGAKSLCEQWDALAEMLNASGGAYKNGEMWKRAWVNMRSKAKQKFQDYKNAMERSGINGSQKNKLTELDERLIAVMSKVAVVGQEEIGEPLRAAGLVPDVSFSPEDDDLEPEPSCSVKTATKNVTFVRKRTNDADAAMLALEREILHEKRRKNDIAEAQVNALKSLNETALKILERLPAPDRF